ncbi:PIG-L deacetylase family protein [Kamptonema formosum]|uniref:PIG-L deacetylase family protein n=1 Tax=Kamptonema formosum TaxID=331992 RepID=UPI0003478F58|nr:PIG-L family deacetylase [Oscillatoria sp. PCC 10802]
MRGKRILNRLKAILLSSKLRDIYSDIQFRWIVRVRSQPISASPKSAMVFSPHQDDETLGCGGAIALKRQQGVPVKVVYLTDGQKSHGKNPPISIEELIQLRKQEALTALNILGVELSETHFLDLPDSTLPTLPEEVRQQAIEQIAQLLKSFQPQEVYVTCRNDILKDHEAAYQLVQAAIAKSGIQTEVLEYPIWGFWKGLLFVDFSWPHLAGICRLPIHSVREQKKRALSAYRSQYLPLGDCPSVVLPPPLIQRFLLPYELFFKRESQSREAAD